MNSSDCRRFIVLSWFLWCRRRLRVTCIRWAIPISLIHTCARGTCVIKSAKFTRFVLFVFVCTFYCGHTSCFNTSYESVLRTRTVIAGEGSFHGERFVCHKKFCSMLTTVLWSRTAYLSTSNVPTFPASAGVTVISCWEWTALIICASSIITFFGFWKLRKIINVEIIFLDILLKIFTWFVKTVLLTHFESLNCCCVSISSCFISFRSWLCCCVSFCCSTFYWFACHKSSLMACTIITTKYSF